MSITNDRYEARGRVCEGCGKPVDDGEWTYCHPCDAWTCGARGHCEHQHEGCPHCGDLTKHPAEAQDVCPEYEAFASR